MVREVSERVPALWIGIWAVRTSRELVLVFQGLGANGFRVFAHS